MGQSVAGASGPIAKFGGQRLYKPPTADIVVKDLIHYPADAVKEVAPPDEFLVVLGGGGNIKLIAPAAVVPVSYTHLDVYKRQPYACAGFPYIRPNTSGAVNPPKLRSFVAKNNPVTIVAM